MMVKLVAFLNRYRALVFLGLALPIIGLWKVSFEVVPASDFQRFKLQVHAPHTQTEEMISRVTEPTEKILNGIEGLLSLESHTIDQVADFEMIFHKDISRQEAYLYIQEKIDRLKIIWPRNVEQVILDEVIEQPKPDIVIKLNQAMSPLDLRRYFLDFQSVIQRSEPSLNVDSKIEILPNERLLFKEKIGLPQIEQALRAKGIIVSLGQKDGTIYEINDNSISLQDLGGLLVGAIGHRPIRLQQVAEIHLRGPTPISQLSLWLDQKKSDLHKDLRAKAAMLGAVSGPRGEFQNQIRFRSIGIWLIILVFQIIFSRYMFGTWKIARIQLAFHFLLGLHFVVWSHFSKGSVSVFDAQALWLASLVFGFFLMVYFGRLRTFFMPELKLKKTTHSIEQASLVSLMELWPSFVVLLLMLYFLWSVFLDTNINPLISSVLGSFFFFAAPSGLFLLLFLPTHMGKVGFPIGRDKLHVPVYWILGKESSARLAYAIIAISVFGLWGVFRHPIAVKTADISDLNLVRGYGKGLIYLDPSVTDDAVFANKKSLYQILDFSNLGLSKLADTNIAEFQQSLKAAKSEASLGSLSGLTDKIPIHLSADLISSVENLTLRDRQNRMMQLKLLTTSSYQQLDSSVYRNRLQKFNFVNYGSRNLLSQTNLMPSQWTSYILNQFKEYYFGYISVGIYCFLLLAIYINSFVRPFILLGLGIAALGIGPLIMITFHWPFHVDSLAFISLAGWFCIGIILLFSRVCDTERTRGHDRDDVVEDIREQLIPVFHGTAYLFCLGVFLTSIFSQWVDANYFSFWSDAWIIALISSGVCYLTFNYLIPLFYLEGEEFLEERAFRILIFVRKIMRQFKRSKS